MAFSEKVIYLSEHHSAGLAMRTVQARSASQTLAFSDTSSQWGATKGIGTERLPIFSAPPS